MCGNINLLLESTESSNHSLCLLAFVCLVQHFVLTHCCEQMHSDMHEVESVIKT